MALKRICGLVSSVLSDVMSVVSPRLCPSCGCALTEKEECLCHGCQAQLASSGGFASLPGNPMEQRVLELTGMEIPCAALAPYVHEGVSGKFVAAFKYRGEKSLAVHMGRMLGISVSGSGRFSGYGVYVPVPLHPQRFRARGYNQAAELCRGMAEAAGGDVCHMLDRVVNTSAQALLSRYDRWGNAKGIFKIAEDVRIPTEGVIVVDDVFTTGATVCAAISALKEAGVKNIAVATLCTAHL